MSYSLREVAAMLGIPPARVRSFASKGFLEPERGARGELRFGFHDLIILRTANELATARIPRRKVRRVLERLREQLPEGRSLTGVRIAADGERVVVSDGDTVGNPESGQSLFDFSVSELAEKTAPLMIRAAEEAKAREDELEADDWYALGCELELTNTEAARDAYERAIRLDAHHADAHVNLGRLEHDEGAPAAAEPLYRRALVLDPRHPTAAFNLGVALEDLGRTREALEAYELALELDPANADAHFNIAGLRERRGQKAEALRHLKMYRALRS
jgi:tetratricopeptide (TPR) repeat protein